MFNTERPSAHSPLVSENTNSLDLVFFDQGNFMKANVVTTSRMIAAKFGKQHDNVLRDIRELVKKLGKIKKKTLCNFTATFYIHPQNNQTYTEYQLNAEAFTLLVMSYSSLDTLGIKLEYLSAFSEASKKARIICEKLSTIEYRGSVGDIVFVNNNKAITTSLLIANKFDRNHKEILRAIDSKLSNADIRCAQFCADHVKKITYIDESNRQQRAFELTKEGFSYIALSLTGTTADNLKIDFIEAFFKMEASLKSMFEAKLLEEVLPQDSRLRQYVYVILNPLTGFVKIGVAQNVENRIKQLETGAGVKLDLIYRSLICSNAFEIEKKAHNYFDKHRVFGEWFSCDITSIISFLEKETYIFKSNFNK